MSFTPNHIFPPCHLRETTKVANRLGSGCGLDISLKHTFSKYFISCLNIILSNAQKKLPVHTVFHQYPDSHSTMGVRILHTGGTQ